MKKMIVVFMLLSLLGCGKITPQDRFTLVQKTYPDYLIFTQDESRFVLKGPEGEILWVEVDVPVFRLGDSKIIMSRRIF